MDKIHLASYMAIGLAILVIILIVLLFLLKKKNEMLAKLLLQQTAISEENRQRLARLQEKHDRIIAFQNCLKTAELTTMLQKPRLDSQNNPDSLHPSQKYRNILDLTQQGMSLEEIAKTLAVSTHEARQMMNLAKLAGEDSQ